MLKKSLLSLAVSASLVGLTGCNISSTTDNANNTPQVQQDNATVEAARGVSPVFNPANKKLPVGIDFIFGALADSTVPDSMKDGTAHTASAGTSGQSPVTDALDILDGGISTLAPIDIPMSGSIDPTSIVAGTNVRLIKLPNGQDMVDQGMVLPTVGDVTVATDVDALDLATIGALFATTKADGSPADDTQVPPESVAARNLFGSTYTGTVDGILFMQPQAGVDYEVVALTQDGVANNTIRIKPLKPLSPKTKYIVMITGGLDAADGTPVEASSDYSFLKGTTELYTPALQGVRDSIGGWEQMAGAIVTAGGSNLAALADGIALTAGFTTVDPTMSLKAMAYPGYWAESDVALNDETTALALQQAAIAAGLTDQTQIDDLKAAFFGASGNTMSASDQNIKATSYLVSGALTGPLAVGGPTAYEGPRARNFELIEDAIFSASPLIQNNQIPLYALNTDTVAVGGNKVLISQGGIELPQYTAALTTDPADSWEGNTAVGGVLDTLAGQAAGTTPPSDIDGSYNVTYRFPFAKEQRKAVVPVLFIEPIDATKAVEADFDNLVAGAAAAKSLTPPTDNAAQAVSAATGNCARDGNDQWPVIIMQHGFTVDRATTLLMGASLAQQNCSVVVAMDLPHHGVSPLSSDRNGADITNSVLGLTVTYNADTAAIAPFALAANTAAAADEDSILNSLQERHEGLYLDATNTTQTMTYGDTKAGKSGDFFIRLDNFARTRDNARQAVVDLLNLNATLATMDIDGDASTGVSGSDLNISNVSYVGHSLGGIVGTTFVATNNNSDVQLSSAVTQIAAQAAGAPAATLPLYYTLPKIQSAVLATPGGGLTKLLENSVSISPKILGGLSVAANIEPGDSNFEAFMRVLQGAVDSADPMNFVGDLAAGGSSATPTMIVEVVGGGAIASEDSNEATTKLPDALITAGGYPADTVVPNNTTSATNESAKMPLAGTDPMLAADALNSVNVDTAGANAQAYPVTKFIEGTHGTFSSADVQDAFAEMVTETATFIGSGGTSITVADDSVLQ